MTSSDSYKTIKSISRGIYKEKGSRFISIAFPVTNEDEVKKIIHEIRKEHYEARHHPYAYVLGPAGSEWRSSDDGEPSGTAGKPILGRIRSFGLTDVLLIVPRYFGGTLLGTSGLANAYKSAAESALSNAGMIEQIIMESCEIKFPYTMMNEVMKIVKEENIFVDTRNFDSECLIKVHFRSSALEKIKSRLSRIKDSELITCNGKQV